MIRLSPKRSHTADECIAHLHIPSMEEKIHASECFDKTVLLAAHHAALHDAYILEMGSHPLNASPITPVSPTSSIGGLKTVSLKQLKIGKKHRNRVLHGTLCTKSLCTKGEHGLLAVVNLFEDEEGKATPICLSNALSENYGSAHAQRIYPQGSRVAVREPYLKRFPDGELGLLVEKQADLVFLWVPEVIDISPEFLEKTPSKDDVRTLENGDVHGNGHVFTPVEVKGLKENEDVSAGVVANGTNDSEPTEVDGSAGVVANGTNDGEPTEVDGETAGRELSVEDILAFRGECGRADGEDDGNEEVKEQRDGGEKGGETGADDGEKAAERELECTTGDIVGSAETDVALAAAEVEKPPKTDFGSAAEIIEAAETSNLPPADSSETPVEEEVAAEEIIGRGASGETSARLRMRGNDFFARGEYKFAAEMYSKAVEKARREEKDQAEEQFSLSNRAEAWLRLGRSKTALDDAEAALVIVSGGGGLAEAKALFRKGRALMGLRRYGEAMVCLEQVLTDSPSDRQLREAAITCRERLRRLTKPGKRRRAASKRQQRPVEA